MKLKKLFLYMAILPTLLSANLFADSQELTIPSIPNTAEEFVQFRNQMAKTPEGGAVVFLTAMMGFSKSEDLGMQFMTIALDKSNLTKGKSYKGFSPHSSLMYHIKRFNQYGLWSYTPFAYVQGSKPDDRYKTSAPYKITVSRNKYSGEEKSGKVKVFIHVYGVSPRPVTMTVNDKGIWKAKEVSSLFLNVQAPPSQESDDL